MQTTGRFFRLNERHTVARCSHVQIIKPFRLYDHYYEPGTILSVDIVDAVEYVFNGNEVVDKLNNMLKGNYIITLDF